jgi:hypothetical protein
VLSLLLSLLLATDLAETSWQSAVSSWHLVLQTVSGRQLTGKGLYRTACELLASLPFIPLLSLRFLYYRLPIDRVRTIAVASLL